MYNMTILQNAETVSGLVLTANSYTEGQFTGMFLVALFFIFFFIMKRYEFEKSLLASSFLCFLLGSVLTMGNLVNFLYPAAFLAVAAMTFLFMTLFNSKS